MPVRSHAGCDDCAKTLGHVLLPVGVCSIGWYFFMKKKEQQVWFENLKKPNWYSTNPTLAIIADLGLLPPVGYAASLVLKRAKFDDDRRLALALYGASLASLAAVAIPTTIVTKNIKQWAGAFGLVSALFGSTAFVFYKIDNTAGLLLVPITAWWAYNAIAMLVMEEKAKP